MSAIIRINRMHVAAKVMENVRDQLDALLMADVCECGECVVCHGIAMLANDAESLAVACRGAAQAGEQRYECQAAD